MPKSVSKVTSWAPCSECGKNSSRVKGDVVYPHRPDLFWKTFYLCECGAYCGAHGDGRPLGFPAGKHTRAARTEAHNIFDLIWKEKHMSRDCAYNWLVKATGIDRLRCHIGMMNRRDAHMVSKLSLAKLKELRK